MLYDFWFFPVDNSLRRDMKRSLFFSAKVIWGRILELFRWCLSFVAMHLQVKKEIIIMEIPERDENGGGEAE